MLPRVILDTNVIVSAFRSRRGAAFRLLELLEAGRFIIQLSIPLAVEYEAVSKRLLGTELEISEQIIDDVLDYICHVAERHDIYFLWRPFLRDPKDDMVLELAVRAECPKIVTYNRRDFEGIEIFGISVVTPAEFLKELEQRL